MVLHVILADILLIVRIFPSPFGARKNTTHTGKISARIICKTIE